MMRDHPGSPPPYQSPGQTSSKPFCPNRIYYIGTWPGPYPFISVYDITDQALPHHPSYIAAQHQSSSGQTHLTVPSASCRPTSASRHPSASSSSTRHPTPNPAFPALTDPAWKRYDKFVRQIAKVTTKPEAELVPFGYLANDSRPPTPPTDPLGRSKHSFLGKKATDHSGLEYDDEDDYDDDDYDDESLFDLNFSTPRTGPTAGPSAAASGPASKPAGLDPPLYIINCSKAWTPDRVLSVVAGPAIRYPEAVVGAQLAEWRFPSERPARTVFTFPPNSPQGRLGNNGTEVTMALGSICQSVGCPSRSSLRRRIPILSAVAEMLTEVTTELYAHNDSTFQWTREKNGSDQFLSLYRHVPVENPKRQAGKDKSRSMSVSSIGSVGSATTVTAATASSSSSSMGSDDCVERVAHYRYLRPPFWSMFSDRPSGASLAVSLDDQTIDPLVCVLTCLNMGCKVLRMDVQRLLNL